RLAFLRLDGLAIAFQFNVEANGVHYHLKGGYDPAFGQLSPGKMLHAELLRSALSSGVHRFEFLGETESYKMQFSDGTRSMVTLDAFSSTPFGYLSRSLAQSEIHLRNTAKRTSSARRLHALATR